MSQFVLRILKLVFRSSLSPVLYPFSMSVLVYEFISASVVHGIITNIVFLGTIRKPYSAQNRTKTF